MIKAVIYDVDGVLVDSEPLHYAAWDKALQLHGQRLNNLSEKVRTTMAGKKLIFIATELVEDLNLHIDPQQLLDEKNTIFMNSIKSNLQGMPHAAESVKNLHKHGYKLGIGTSLTKDYIDIVINNLSLKGCFEVIITEEEIKRGKPFPDTYLAVANKLECKPEECVVIEDTQSGVKSAKSAGCFCIALKNPHVPPQNTLLADKQIASLSEITYELIQKLQPAS